MPPMMMLRRKSGFGFQYEQHSTATPGSLFGRWGSIGGEGASSVPSHERKAGHWAHPHVWVFLHLHLWGAGSLEMEVEGNPKVGMGAMPNFSSMGKRH